MERFGGSPWTSFTRGYEGTTTGDDMDTQIKIISICNWNVTIDLHHREKIV